MLEIDTPAPVGSVPWRIGALLAAVFSFREAVDLNVIPLQVYPQWTGPIFLLFIVSLGCLMLAIAARPRTPAPPLAVVSIPTTYVLVVVLAGMFAIARSPHAFFSDEMAFSADAARLVAHGMDPYLHAMGSPWRFPTGPLTPTMQGGFMRDFSYPSLAFLVYVPAVLMGLHNIAFVNLILALVALVLLYAWSPPPLRPFTPAIFLVARLMPFSLGATDTIYLVPMLAVVRYIRDRPWVSAVAFGLACAVKQTPWFVAPPLAVAVWWEAQGTWGERLRTTVRWTAVAVGAFLVPNLPYIAMNPAAWLRGTFAPVFGHLVTAGVGLVDLARLPDTALPSTALFLIPGGVFLVALALAMRWYPRLPALPFAFPALITLFLPRSLDFYLFFSLPALVLAVARLTPLPAPARSARAARAATLVPAVTGLAAVAVGIRLWAAMPLAVVPRVVGVEHWTNPYRRVVFARILNRSDRPVRLAYFVSNAQENFALWSADGPTRVPARTTVEVALRDSHFTPPLPGEPPDHPAGPWLQLTVTTPSGDEFSGPVYHLDPTPRLARAAVGGRHRS